MLKKLMGIAQQGSKSAEEMFSRFQNASFANATMAGCALISAADGNITADERQKTAQFITTNSNLKAFNVSELRSKYEEYCGLMNRDADFGKIELLQIIAKASNKPEDARAIVQVCMIIAKADGDFSEPEKNVMREIIRNVRLDIQEFGL